MFECYRFACAVPPCRTADLAYNTSEILKLYLQAAENGASVVLFPALAVTGDSCGDLFDLPSFVSAAEEEVEKLASATSGKPTIMVVGTVWRDAGKCVEAAAKIDGPVFIRTARLPSPVYEERPFQVGKGNVIKDGKDVVIFCCGIMLEHCLEAVEILAANGIDAALVNHHTLKPFDEELTREYAAKCGKVFTVEEHSVIGGLGDAVASAICGMGLEKFQKIGINDEFGQSGKPADLLVEYGLTGPQIAEKIMKA